MNDSQPLALRQPLDERTWAMIAQVAPAIAKGRVWPMPSPEAAMSVMLMGAELGLSFTASFQYIHFIENKPSLSPQGALAVIRQSGMLESMQIQETKNPVGCTVTMTRSGGESYSVTWTVDDAKRAGLVRSGPNGDGNWIKYPANMCRWRAIGYCADFLFPDVLGGLKRADEFGAAIDEAGNVVEATFTPQPVEVPVPPTVTDVPVETQPDALTYTVDGLIEDYGAEAFVAAGGMEAQTISDLTVVARKLEATIPYHKRDAAKTSTAEGNPDAG